MSVIIKIPFLANDVDIVSGYFIGGLPSLTAIEGFSHATERKFQKFIDSDCQVNAWSFVLDNIEYNKGRTIFAAHEKSRKRKDMINTPASMDMKARVVGHIILDLDTEHTESDFITMRRDGLLNPIFSSARLAGGDMWISLDADNSRVVNFFNYDSDDEFTEAMTDCLSTINPHSMIIEDKTFLINQNTSAEKSNLDVYFDLISRKPKKQRESKHELTLELFSILSASLSSDELFYELEKTLEKGELISQIPDFGECKEFLCKVDSKINLDNFKITTVMKDELTKLTNSLAAKIKVLRNEFQDELDKNNFAEKYNLIFCSDIIEEDGYLIPVTIGYHAISKKKLREGTRNDSEGNKVKHVFAEPVLGLARLRKVCSAKQEVISDSPNFMLWANNRPMLESESSKEYVITGMRESALESVGCSIISGNTGAGKSLYLSELLKTKTK